tara:strand:+ start:570 stop:1127 length:558 start_codon:yes stop_codon:yes gene_type:complete
VGKYHFTYQTTNLINGKIYVGVHSTYNIDDDYLGSGKFLKLAIKKYGKSNFQKVILNLFNTIEEAYVEESYLVDSKFISNPKVYNATVGGNGGYKGGNGGEWTPTRRRKCSERFKGRNNVNWKGLWVTPLGTFNSSREAAKVNNISKSTLIARCRGFVWQYPKNKGKYKQSVYSKGFTFVENCGS